VSGAAEMPEPPAAGAPRRDPYTHLRRALLTPEEVRELSRLRPARAVADVAWLWAQILLAWTVVFLHPTWWVVLLAIPVIGTRHYALHVIAHDGIHRRVLPNAGANDLFTDLFLLGPVASVVRVHGRNHLLHHRHLARDADPDRHKYASGNKRTPGQVLLYLSGLSSLAPLLRNVFLRGAGEEGGRPGRGLPDLRPRDLAIVGGWQLALATGLTLGTGAWWGYPLLWLLPVYLFTYLGDVARQFLEHAHPEPDAVADGHRLITYTSSAPERLLFAPRGMNFHAAHHLWPSIPYYHLARADRLMRERNRSQELSWRGSYLGALVAYLRALPIGPLHPAEPAPGRSPRR